MAPILTTLLVAIAAGFLGVNVVKSRLFLADAPRGHAGLVVILYFFAAVIGAVALLLATAACASAGGLGPAGPRWIQAVGIALGAVVAVLVWGGRRTALVTPAGIVGGTVGPAALAAVLLTGAWHPEATARHARLIDVALWPLAVVGHALWIGYAGALARLAIQNEQRKWEADQARDREIERRHALSMIDRLREEYPQMGDAAPLWSIVASLPDAPDDETRQFIVARALKVPDLDVALMGTGTTRHPRYRHGCLDLIRFAPEPRPDAWRPVVGGAIAVTVGEMSERPTWLADADYMSNPHPVDHVRALVESARRVAPDGELKEAIESLRTAIERLPAGEARTAALRSFG